MSEADKTRLPPPMPEVAAGAQLSGIYELDQRLASGGMGEVWRGHNIQTGDLVAIKIVLPEFARDQTILSLFRKEASILNHLSHDAIVRYHVFTIDRDIGRPYLAMEFVNGESLFDVMRAGPMPVEAAARLCLRLAEALAAVHGEGVFHRDLSPDNIVLPGGRVERAKIIDFGIARSATIGEGTLIGGRFAGKYNYVSPEQLGLFGGEVEAESDIYSLGLVMAAALRGKPLDMNGTQFEVLEKRRKVPDLDGVDERLLPLLDAMLQPDPRERPESMELIAEWLRANFAPARGGAAQTAPPTLPPPGRAAPEPWETPGARPFVPHVAPAALGPRPDPGPTVPAFEEKGSGGKAAITAAALALLLIAGGTGAYFTGLLPWGAEPVPVAPPESKPPPQPEPPAQDEPPPKPSPVLPKAEPQPQPKPVPPEPTPPKPPTPGPVAPPAPKPPVEALDDAAERIAWLRSYSGGDCFFAAATAATDKAIAIEGFGTGVEPFRKLLDAFQGRFGIDPDIGVRQIAPAQCAAADFLRAVAPMAEAAPELTLDATAVADGSTVSGTLAVPPGHTPYLLLIDHDGMAFSLNDRMSAAGEASRFKVPIGLSAADRSAGKALPELILAIAAPIGSLDSAVFRQPGPAAQVLPKILEEMRRRGLKGAAAAKYFQLGG